MKAATSGQMRNIDFDASEIYGIPSIVLMENAGIKVFSHIINEIDCGKVCFICGTGNNGGDGFAAARHLLSYKRCKNETVYKDNSYLNDIVVYVAGDEAKLKGDALINYNIAKKSGMSIKFIKQQEDLESLKQDIISSRIVVDGLLGTGVKGEVSELYKSIICAINQYAHYIISIDIPSGIDTDTGKILGAGVRANRTVTFVLPKIGLYVYPGAEYAGEVIVEDISIPMELVDKQHIDVNIMTGNEVRCFFKKRNADTNKGTYGRALIIAGSKDMAGAAAMCVLSALRCGAGIVEACVPRSIQTMIVSQAFEAIVKGLDEEDGYISEDSYMALKDYLEQSSAVAIGPGIGRSKGTAELIKKVILECKTPLVIDADGLNLLTEEMDVLYNAKGPVILTPHPKEAARITKRTVNEIQSDRIGWAKKLSAEYGVVTVLKGANTIISSPDGEVYINTTGNPGMAKGGSGDILTGMIVSLLAQGINPPDAAKTAVYVHGLAGDMACNEIGEYGMKPGDIIDYIPYAIKAVSV